MMAAQKTVVYEDSHVAEVETVVEQPSNEKVAAVADGLGLPPIYPGWRRWLRWLRWPLKKDAQPVTRATVLQDDLLNVADDDTIEPRRRWWGRKSYRPYIVAKILLQNDRIISKAVWIKKGSVFKFKGHAYDIKREAIKTEKINKKWRPVSYYFFEWPDPIMWVYKKTYEQETSENFRALLDSKVTRDAVGRGEEWLLWLIAGLAAVILLALIILLWRLFRQ